MADARAPAFQEEAYEPWAYRGKIAPFEADGACRIEQVTRDVLQDCGRARRLDGTSYNCAGVAERCCRARRAIVDNLNSVPVLLKVQSGAHSDYACADDGYGLWFLRRHPIVGRSKTVVRQL